MLRASPSQSLVGYAIGVAVVTSVLLVGTFQRRKLPRRLVGQSSDEFWTEDTLGRVVVLWIVYEGDAIIASVGYVLTAHWAPAIGGLIAVLGLLTSAPRYLAIRT